jgi:cytochrome P450
MTACPHLDEFDPLNAAEIADPYPSWDVARRQAGVVYVPKIGRYVAVSYEAVREVLMNTEQLSSRGIPDVGEVPEDMRDRLPDGYPLQSPALINCDGARHTTIRKLTQQAFTIPRVTAMEPEIRTLAADLLDAVADRPAFDLVADFAGPLSTIALARTLGVPDEQASRFRDFSDTIIGLTTIVMSDHRRRDLTRAAADFNDYANALVQERAEHPRDDVITALLAASDPDTGERLPRPSVVSIISQLIIAGHETTATLIGNTAWLLLSRRERWETVYDNRALIAPTLEESLRRMAPIKHLQRIALEDVTIDGIAVPAGATILVGYGAANADPAVSAAPLEFDLEREDARHLAFGHGKHFCLGAPLARLEGALAIEALLDHFPHLGLDPDDQPERVAALSVFSFSRLPVLTDCRDPAVTG